MGSVSELNGWTLSWCQRMGESGKDPRLCSQKCAMNSEHTELDRGGSSLSRCREVLVLQAGV